MTRDGNENIPQGILTNTQAIDVASHGIVRESISLSHIITKFKVVMECKPSPRNYSCSVESYSRIAIILVMVSNK